MQPSAEEARADRDDLRPGCGAAHLAAEEAVPGGDARYMRAVCGGDDADVDPEEAGDRRCLWLNDERNRLADRRRRVVVSEAADVTIDAEVLHRRLVGEAGVVVGVDEKDVIRSGRVASRLPQHDEEVTARTVAVEVRTARDAVLAGGTEQVLTHASDAIGAVRNAGVGATELESCAVGDLHESRCEEPPRRVAVRGWIGKGDPILDLLSTRARRVQARMTQVDAGVDDADCDPAAVPRRM